MRQILIIPLALLFSMVPAVSTAQPHAENSYYPLEVGNAWSFFRPADPPFRPHSEPEEYAIDELVFINDTSYAIAPHPFSLADTLRIDQVGRIWARILNRDVLLYDFSLADSATYTFQSPRHNMKVLVERNLSVTVEAGQFDEVVRFSFDDPNSIDEEQLFAFAPDVGPIQATGSIGIYRELHSATVNGIVITGVESHHASSREIASAFPNPFVDFTTIRVPYGGSRPPRARVFDILGRELAHLEATACFRGNCYFTLDGANMPAGLYYVVPEGSFGGTATVILVR